MLHEWEIDSAFENTFGGTDTEPLTEEEKQDISEEAEDYFNSQYPVDFKLLVITCVENREFYK